MDTLLVTKQTYFRYSVIKIDKLKNAQITERIYYISVIYEKFCRNLEPSTGLVKL